MPIQGSICARDSTCRLNSNCRAAIDLLSSLVPYGHIRVTKPVRSSASEKGKSFEEGIT